MKCSQKALVKFSNMLYSKKGFAKERGMILKVFCGETFVNMEKLKEAGLNNPIKLEYYKMVNENELKKQKIYGIKIIKKEYKRNGVITEEKEIKHLSNDETKIEKILHIFKENLVTPISVDDIVTDLLKQSI